MRARIVNCPGRPGRLSGLSVFHSKSVLYGAFVWARRALNDPKRRFPARAVWSELGALVRDGAAFAKAASENRGVKGAGGGGGDAGRERLVVEAAAAKAEKKQKKETKQKKAKKTEQHAALPPVGDTEQNSDTDGELRGADTGTAAGGGGRWVHLPA